MFLLIPGNILASAVRKCCRGGDLLLVAENGNYVSRVPREIMEMVTIQTIQASKSTPDESSHFKVHNVDDGTILLQADNDNYLCRVEDLWGSSVEASKSTPDRSCHFTVYNQPNGTVVFQADNGKFLSRIYYIGGGQYIEAAKSQIDVICKFCFVQE